MHFRRASLSRRSLAPSPHPEALVDAMIAMRGPAEAVLTQAVRRLARRRPELFGRLGPHQASVFRISPTDVPVAFDLTPSLYGGAVRVVRHTASGAPVAQMSAPLVDLLALFDGSLDADAAFFRRKVQVDGDVAAVMALHNALEAADLRLGDLLPLPAIGDPLNRILAGLLRRARRSSAPAGA